MSLLLCVTSFSCQLRWICVSDRQSMGEERRRRRAFNDLFIYSSRVSDTHVSAEISASHLNSSYQITFLSPCSWFSPDASSIFKHLLNAADSRGFNDFIHTNTHTHSSASHWMYNSLGVSAVWQPLALWEFRAVMWQEFGNYQEKHVQVDSTGRQVHMSGSGSDLFCSDEADYRCQRCEWKIPANYHITV